MSRLEEQQHIRRSYKPRGWLVGDDTSIQPRMADSYDSTVNYVGVEVVSPPLYCTDEALTDIRTVIETITSNFDTFVNRSCGFHVHVGRESEGFTFNMLRKFCTMVVGFQNQITSLRPTWRQRSKYCIGMNQVKPFRRKTPLKQIEMVRNAPNKFRLIDYLNPDGRFFAYSLENLRFHYEADDTTSKPTIEFRQHEGTLDVVAVIGWVKFVNYLVAYVCSHTDERIYNLAVEQGLDPKFNVYDLMTTIGASYLHNFFPTLHNVLGPSERLPLETADVLPR